MWRKGGPVWRTVVPSWTPWAEWSWSSRLNTTSQDAARDGDTKTHAFLLLDLFFHESLEVLEVGAREGRFASGVVCSHITVEVLIHVCYDKHQHQLVEGHFDELRVDGTSLSEIGGGPLSWTLSKEAQLTDQNYPAVGAGGAQIDKDLGVGEHAEAVGATI